MPFSLTSHWAWSDLNIAQHSIATVYKLTKVTYPFKKPNAASSAPLSELFDIRKKDCGLELDLMPSHANSDTIRGGRSTKHRLLGGRLGSTGHAPQPRRSHPVTGSHKRPHGEASLNRGNVESACDAETRGCVGYLLDRDHDGDRELERGYADGSGALGRCGAVRCKGG